MAKTSNLRNFQEAILLKLKEATAHGATESTSRLGVQVGDKRMLINLSEIVEVLPVPSVKAVPFTQPWFLGVANVRGVLYNLTDLAQFMGMHVAAKYSINRILLLNSQSATQAALLVNGLLGLRGLEEMQAQPLDSEVLFAKRTLIDTHADKWTELDLEALVRDEAFIQPTV